MEPVAIISYAYDAAGRVVQTILPNKVKTTYTYADNGDLICLENKKANGTVISRYTYTYDKAGNRLTETAEENDVSLGTVSYSYDGQNRLKSVQYPDGRKENYFYDSSNNRTAKRIYQNDELLSETRYVYDNRERLTHVSEKRPDGGEERLYNYDKNGNVLEEYRYTSAPVGNSEKLTLTEGTAGSYAAYQYNPLNQLVSYQGEGGVASYVYNYKGLRAAKTLGGRTTKYLYDEAGNVILETDETNKAIAKNTYGLRGISRNSANYIYNGHGDVTALLDASGTVLNTYAYDAFGNIANKTENADNPYTYCGEYTDKETGNIYLRARYYDPGLGRFLSEDPYWTPRNRIYGSEEDVQNPNIEAIRQSVNLYAYCANNPVILIDSSGLASVAIRDYTNGYGGTVKWDNTWGVASFSISGITLWVTGSGYNENDIRITNIDGRLYAEDSDLDAFFGQALTWGKEDGNAGKIMGSGMAIAGGVAMADSPAPGPADVAGAAIAAGTVVVAGGAAIYDMATSQKGKYGDSTVKEVLKHRKGSIKQAPLPPGSPGWDKLLPLTMDAIRKAADKGEIGMKTIWKLLNDSRFYK